MGYRSKQGDSHQTLAKLFDGLLVPSHMHSPSPIPKNKA